MLLFQTFHQAIFGQCFQLSHRKVQSRTPIGGNVPQHVCLARGQCEQFAVLLDQVLIILRKT